MITSKSPRKVLKLAYALGVETLLHIKSGEQTLVSTVPGMTRIQLGSDLRFDIVRERLHFFDSSGERVKG